MQRLTISLDDDLAAEFDALVAARGYENRSEAFRDLVRGELADALVQHQPHAPCVATLTLLFDHHERTLSSRLMDAQHEHHDLTVSSTHAHLNHDLCLETTILRGPTDRVQTFAAAVLALRGVRQGHLHVMPLLVHSH